MMRDSEVKRKLKNGETVSLVLQSTHPGTAEAIALAGVDMIVIDNEHGAFTTEQITNTARAVTALGKAAVARTTVYDKNALAHLMDTGISGVFVTMIRDASAAQEVINGVKFRLPDGEPGGERGVCFNSRAAHYGMHGMAKEDYLDGVMKIPLLWWMWKQSQQSTIWMPYWIWNRLTWFTLECGIWPAPTDIRDMRSIRILPS